MGRLEVFTVLGLMLCIFSVRCKNEKEAREYLKKIDSPYKELNQDHYENLWSESEEPERGLLNLLNSIILTEEVALKLRQYEYQTFDDVDLARQAQLLVNAGSYTSNDEEELIKIMRATIQLANIAKERKICEFQGSENCSLAYFPDVAERVAKSSDDSELEHYWKEFRNKFGDKGRNLLSDSAILLARGANISGFPEPTAMYYAEYENSNLLNIFESAIESMKPLYRELHAHVLQTLRKEYGSDVIPAIGLMPHHILEHLILEAFKADSNLHLPFPKEPFPNVTEYIIQKNLTTMDLIKKGEAFFTSLGFDSLPEEFFENEEEFLKPMSTEGYICLPEVYPFMRTAAGYKFCPNVDLRGYLQKHYDMAYIYYDQLYREQPAAYAQETAPGFGKAVGEAMGLSAVSPTHLKTVLNLKYHDTYKNNINRLYRLAIYFVFSIHQRFVEEKFWINVLNGKIDKNDFNSKYWSYQLKYAGAVPPAWDTDKRDEYFDMSPYFYHKFGNNVNTQYLFSEILGFDLFKAFCKISNQYDPNNVAEKPLHKCNFFAKKIIGFVLRPLLTQGKQQSWNEILQTIATDPLTLGHGLTEYFDPLYNWLRDNNQKNKVTNFWEKNEIE